MIARMWQHGGDCAGYIDRTGIKECAETPSNRGAWMLRRDTGDQTWSC